MHPDVSCELATVGKSQLRSLSCNPQARSVLDSSDGYTSKHVYNTWKMATSAGPLAVKARRSFRMFNHGVDITSYGQFLSDAKIGRVDDRDRGNILVY